MALSIVLTDAMGGRDPTITDEELLEIIERECQSRGVPALPTKRIANADGVPIQRQAVFSRLEDLDKEGRVTRIEAQEDGASVWCVSEDEDIDADLSSIAWENIPAEEIPEWKLEEHPEYQDPPYWERRAGSAASRLNYGAGLGLVGLIVIFAPDLGFIPPATQDTVQTLAALAALGGVALVVISLLEWFLSQFCQSLVNRGYDETVEVARSGIRGWIVSKIGYRIVPVSGDGAPNDEQDSG